MSLSSLGNETSFFLLINGNQKEGGDKRIILWILCSEPRPTRLATLKTSCLGLDHRTCEEPETFCRKISEE